MMTSNWPVLLIGLSLLVFFMLFAFYAPDVRNIETPPFKQPGRIFSVNHKKPAIRAQQAHRGLPQKTILIYSNLFGSRRWSMASNADRDPDYFKRIGCKVTNCRISYDNSKVRDAAALVFHARDMPNADLLRRISRTSRPAHQYWAYFVSESPVNCPNPKPLEGLFNLTMTYRLSSDVFLPYRKFAKLKEPRKITKNYARSKTKMAAWLVSNCGVKTRERVVRHLEKHGVQVDVGGGCRRRWPHQLRCLGRECTNQEAYRFHLGFENSYCQDYITNKYWWNGFDVDAIPVVLGGADYHDPKVAIPGSFIDVQDFDTVQDLAEYMLKVANNETLFNSYFKWKESYYLVDNTKYRWPYAGENGWPCELCEMVNRRKPLHKVYNNLSDFWSAKNDCGGRNKKILKILQQSDMRG